MDSRDGSAFPGESTPKAPEDSDGVYRSVIRAKALDTLRGLLPAATQSKRRPVRHGPAYEALLLRMFLRTPLEEVRAHAQVMLSELRRIIPAFLARIDSRRAAAAGSNTLAETRRAFEDAARPSVMGRTRASPKSSSLISIRTAS